MRIVIEIEKMLRKVVFTKFTVFAAFIFLGQTPVWANEKAELISSLDSVSKALDKEKSASIDVIQALKTLQASVNGLLKKANADPGSALAEASEILKKNIENKDISGVVEDLGAQVFVYKEQERDQFVVLLANKLAETLETKGAPALSDAARVALLSLETSIQISGESDPNALIRLQAVRLKDNLDASTNVNSGDVEISELGDLLTKLRDLEKNKFFTALRARTNELNEIIGDPVKLRPFLRLSDIQNLAGVRQKLNTLLADDKDVHSGVHIVSATYGRVSGPKSPGDQCDARATVVNACQAQDKCSLSADAFAKLCGGFDPAPFLQGASRGLSVRYVCLANTPKSVWNDLMRADPSDFGGRARTAILRSESDGFRCAVN